ncbi:cytochrome c [Aestuariibacter sp. AA17]|uniref:Cytochrome c n=1 Tax=Fluctibacter corallii TaxID=2984329 RepID=A0ABT3A8Y6_9ALTE|nr:cytochrome c [Aestuariibacter sp. AA17]MCV2885126.1 cytochrome c [Aestuariibacter sp. AA17]
MKKLMLAVALSVSSISCGVIAEEAKSEKQAKTAVEFRQALMQLVRSNVGSLGAMSKGKIPFDAASMEKSGLRLEQLSLMMEDYFALDTRKFDVGSESLPKVWEDQADYKEKIQALTDAAAKLQNVAAAGNDSQYKAAIGGIFKTCKGCHDNYKAD